MKTTFTDSFQLKRAYKRAKMFIHFYLFKWSSAILGCPVISVYVLVYFMHANYTKMTRVIFVFRVTCVFYRLVTLKKCKNLRPTGCQNKERKETAR
jgi:hypothetical protein